MELTSAQSPKWELIAARLLGASFRRELSGRLKVLGITDFYSKLCYLTEEKLYGEYILEHYTKEEIQEAETFYVRKGIICLPIPDWICCLNAM